MTRLARIARFFGLRRSMVGLLSMVMLVGLGERMGERFLPLKVLGQMRPALRDLLIADILVRFCEQIPYAFVVVWCVTKIAAPVTELQFGILTSIEMVTAMLIYVPVAYLADRSRKKPFVVMTFVFFTLFPLVLLFCQSFVLLAGVFVLRGLKEFGEPTRKALIMDLAPEGRKASMFGAYYLVRDLVVSLAAFGGAFLWMTGPAANFLAASSFGAAGTLWFALRGRDLSGDSGGKCVPSPQSRGERLGNRSSPQRYQG